MKKVSVFEKESIGKVKPMHAVTNGPVYKFGSDQRITNIDAFRDAGIPYARNHDASLYMPYGGEHIVDVHAIFPNFDADPYDEASYDFVCTDEYLRVIDHAGVKTFYRLGSKIEHSIKKYGTLPPKDFKKWAIICEHIIKHYNYGWANGFHYGIEYWEIWNEPVDMLMYYDARPGAMNGMFCTDWVCENLKGYYPFRMFNELYKKDSALRVDRSEADKIYLAAAKNEDTTSIMLTYFDNDEKEALADVEISLEGAEGTRTAEIYLLDGEHDMELVKTETVGDKISLKLSLFSTVLINLK